MRGPTEGGRREWGCRGAGSEPLARYQRREMSYCAIFEREWKICGYLSLERAFIIRCCSTPFFYQLLFLFIQLESVSNTRRSFFSDIPSTKRADALTDKFCIDKVLPFGGLRSSSSKADIASVKWDGRMCFFFFFSIMRNTSFCMILDCRCICVFHTFFLFGKPGT